MTDWPGNMTPMKWLNTVLARIAAGDHAARALADDSMRAAGIDDEVRS